MADAPDTTPQKRRLLANPLRGYAPPMWGGGFLGPASAAVDGKPWFTWFDIPRMLRDPRVRFMERMWRSPFQRVKFQVLADDPRVARHVGRAIRRVWTRSLPRLLSRYCRFGFAPAGAEFVARGRAVLLDRLTVVEPPDARPLVWRDGANKGLPAGFETGGGRVLLPHAVWFAGLKDVSPWYDVPVMAGAFEPWVEKRGRNGATDSRRTWYRKGSVRGAVVRHPPGTSNYGTDEEPQVRNNQDVAREIADYAEAFSYFTFEHTKHPGIDGKYAWEYEPTETYPDRAGFREYPKDLDAEISEGYGIPVEVFEAADVGSGWSGRMIPLIAWLGGVDELVGLVVEAIDPVLKYDVAANFSPAAWFEVQPQSLVEQVQEQGQAGKGGGEGENPVPELLGAKKTPAGWEPYNRRDGSKGLKNGTTHQYRALSASGFVPKHIRRQVKKLLRARDLADGRGWDETQVARDHGKFSSKPGAKGKAKAGGDTPAKLPAKAVALAGRVLAKGAAAAGKAEHVLVNAVLAAHKKLPAGLRGVVGAAFRLSMAGFDAGQAAAAAAALDRGVSPENVAKVGHLLAVADVAMFKATKAAALLGIPGGKAAFAVAGSIPVASLCYLGYSAAANPVKTAKAAIKAVRAALTATGRNVAADAKSVPADFAASVKKLARYAGVGSPAKALSDGRGEDGLRALMAAMAAAAPARADWLVACFAAALAETNGDRDAAAALAVEAAGRAGGRSLSDDRGGARHAPKGGVTIGGTTYPGGTFVPAEVVAGATPAERAALDGAPQPAPKSPPPSPPPPPPAAPAAADADEPAWKAHPSAGVMTAAIAAAPGLSEEQRRTYSAAAARVLGRMPPRALDRLHAHVKGVTFHPTNEAVGEAVAAEFDGRPGGEAFAAKVREMAAGGYAPGGAYNPHTGTVHADGGFPTDNANGMVSKSLPEATPAHIYAHEWAHAVDGPKNELTLTERWYEAFYDEFGGGRLTAYASTKPTEAWAEFARAVYAADVPLARVEAAFPKASAYWKECGLWPV